MPSEEFLEKVRQTEEIKRKIEELTWRRKKHRNERCAKCNKKVRSLGQVCSTFYLVECDICGGLFCCRHIMLFSTETTLESRGVGVCKKCWKAAPETKNVKKDWKSYHRSRHRH